MIYINIFWIIMSVLLSIYHIRKGVQIAEWNTLFIVFWIGCVFIEMGKLNASL